jgi:myo-inositol-1(or 4)-monophosphatase
VTEPGDLLDLAASTALEAGRLVADAHRGHVVVADTKSSPTDVVTATDVASERLILDRILSARPGDGFVGEEGNDLPSSTGVVWIADPIDGTVNFLYGIPQFAISIAAEVDGEVVAGVVLNPINGEMFTSARGQGAWLADRRITVSDRTDITQALVGTGYSYEADVRAAQALETARLLPMVRDVRRMGSAALDLCYVACGRYDAYVERGLHAWDLAAAQLIVEEAGGRVEGIEGGPPGELIVTAAPSQLYDVFHERLVDSGFADWPLAHWPGH